jgi:hypothetical protein
MVKFQFLLKPCVCFQNDSSVSFDLHDRLVIPEQQAVVVSFLVRVADRRSAARRVKELGRILLKASPSWQHLLMNAEPRMQNCSSTIDIH